MKGDFGLLWRSPIETRRDYRNVAQGRFGPESHIPIIGLIRTWPNSDTLLHAGDAGISQENSDSPTSKCCPRITSGLPTNCSESSDPLHIGEGRKPSCHVTRVAEWLQLARQGQTDFRSKHGNIHR